MRTTPRLVGAACAAALLVSACSSSQADPEPDETTTGPTASAEPSSEATSTSEDPFAMPDPVTEEYVDRVVNTLYEEWGAITRDILEQPVNSTGPLDVETRERIAQVFAGESLTSRFDEAEEILRGDRENLKPPEEFTSINWQTRLIYTASEECIVAAGDFDTSGTSVQNTTILTAISLRPTSADNPSPTGWLIMDALANTGEGGEVLADEVMLEASIDDFGELLQTNCEGL